MPPWPRWPRLLLQTPARVHDHSFRSGPRCAHAGWAMRGGGRYRPARWQSPGSTPPPTGSHQGQRSIRSIRPRTCPGLVSECALQPARLPPEPPGPPPCSECCRPVRCRRSLSPRAREPHLWQGAHGETGKDQSTNLKEGNPFSAQCRTSPSEPLIEGSALIEVSHPQGDQADPLFHDLGSYGPEGHPRMEGTPTAGKGLAPLWASFVGDLRPAPHDAGRTYFPGSRLATGTTSGPVSPGTMTRAFGA